LARLAQQQGINAFAAIDLVGRGYVIDAPYLYGIDTTKATNIVEGSDTTDTDTPTSRHTSEGKDTTGTNIPTSRHTT
jgi:hypothetical protein